VKTTDFSSFSRFFVHPPFSPDFKSNTIQHKIAAEGSKKPPAAIFRTDF